MNNANSVYILTRCAKLRTVLDSVRPTPILGYLQDVGNVEGKVKLNFLKEAEDELEKLIRRLKEVGILSGSRWEDVGMGS